MEDASEVGRYGTIRLLKHREPFSVIATYPIDDEELTFGRDADCGVRLYYQEVSPVHCRLVFEDKKAFLQVLGTNGIIIDGCPVFPAKISGPDSTPTTVPLLNGNTFEIFRKRFVFNYPPKSIRPQLFTPATARRKSIRMSLVNSAVVFTPAPSPFPQENLRILQSPLKISSLNQTVTLVDGNHPRVFEEEQDLVILEDIAERGEPTSPTPARMATLPLMHQSPLPPKTPRRRAAPSLHRAVLIRSAQRVAVMRETQDQLMRNQLQFQQPTFKDDVYEDVDEGEEEEVSNSILNISDEEDGEDDNSDDLECIISGDLKPSEDREVPDEQDECDITEARDEYYTKEALQGEVHYTTPLQVSRTFQLSNTETPRIGPLTERLQSNSQFDQSRTGPQRPPPGYRFSSVFEIKEEDLDTTSPDENSQVVQPPSPSKRPTLSVEERKAILERRKSALKVAEPDIPGLGARRSSVIPMGPFPPASPFKTLSADIEQGEDTRSAIRRMEAQLLELRRNSTSPTRSRTIKAMPSSPEKNFHLLSNGESSTPNYKQLKQRMMDEIEMDDAGGLIKNEDDDESINEDSLLEENSKPQTPLFGGLRNMFHNSKASSGLETPAIVGVREMFHNAPENPQTPDFSYMRHVFTEKRKLSTPNFDGIDDMMRIEDSEKTQRTGNDKDASGSNEILNSGPLAATKYPATRDHESGIPRASTKQKIPPVTRTLVRSGIQRPNLIRTRTVSTDISVMADDEATPSSLPITNLKTREQMDIPEAAVVHRTTRGRRKVRDESDVADDEASTNPNEQGIKINTRKGKVSNLSQAPSKLKTERSNNISRRNVRGSSLQSKLSAPTRRSTRSRSRSVDMDNEEIPTNKYNGGAMSKSTLNIDSIMEDEECDSGSAFAVNTQKANVEEVQQMPHVEVASTSDQMVKKGSKSSQAKNNIRQPKRTLSVDSERDSATASDKDDKENAPRKSSTPSSGNDHANTRIGKPSSRTRSSGREKEVRATKSRAVKLPPENVRIKKEDAPPTLRITRSRAKK